jgi:SAM-dependent methyltransferase
MEAMIPQAEAAAGRQLMLRCRGVKPGGRDEPTFYGEPRQRADYAVRFFPEILCSALLDVGCGERHLAPYARGVYVGVDRRAPADVRADLERGALPFADGSFDAVACLDVLEHLDRPHEACAELARVTRRWVLISLPNAYDLTHRWSFVRGRGLPRRYGLPEHPPAERHKWTFGYSEAERFARTRPGLRLVRERPYYPPRRHPLRPLMTHLNRRGRRLWPNLLALAYWALLERTEASR